LRQEDTGSGTELLRVWGRSKGAGEEKKRKVGRGGHVKMDIANRGSPLKEQERFIEKTSIVLSQREGATRLSKHKK